MAIETVVKVGGSLLRDPDGFLATVAALEQLSMQTQLLVIPGGGPFADAVRRADTDFALAPSASHWMAVLAMDQHGELLATRITRGVRVQSAAAAVAVAASGGVPVLAPSSWLRIADPLPHSWDVTSDSIAAWVAGAVGARSLVLVKASHACAPLVDEYFERALPSSVRPTIVTADQLHKLFEGARP